MCQKEGCNFKTDKPLCYRHYLHKVFGDEAGEQMFVKTMNRMRARVEKRRYKMRNGTWIGEDGERWQVCDYQGNCHYPCNGDC